MRRATVLAGLILVLATDAAAEDLFAGSPRGRLEVRIELGGENRVAFPNGVEWAAIDARRMLNLTFALVNVGNDGLPIVSPKGARDTLSPKMEALRARLAACGDNQQCLSQAMMELAANGGGNPFLEMTGQQPGRYANYAVDRSGTCASGTLAVEDVLSGVYIPPPEPARDYRFTRKGTLTLPQDDFALMDAACSAEVSLDRQTGRMSLRLPAAKLSVPVTLGAGAFTDERAVPLIEGSEVIELFEQPGGHGGAWSGVAEIAAAGSASHNSGQVVAPLKARVAWTFSED